MVFDCWTTPPQGWLFSFSGSKRFNPVQQIRCSVVLKAHGPLLRLHALASAPSNGAQFPGAYAQTRGPGEMLLQKHWQCAKDTEGHVQRTMCKEWNGSRSLFWQTITSGNPLQKGCRLSRLPVSFFPLFPLSRRLFQSFARLRLGCCSSNIQPNCIHGGFIFICLWASIVLYPTQGFSLRASSPPQAENIHPLAAFLPALLVSILDCLENPLQLLSILKECSVHCALCNTSAFLVSVGHIPWHGKSVFLQGKARRYGGVLAGAMAQGTVSFLVPYHLKISNVFALFFFWYSTMHSSARFAG